MHMEIFLPRRINIWAWIINKLSSFKLYISNTLYFGADFSKRSMYDFPSFPKETTGVMNFSSAAIWRKKNFDRRVEESHLESGRQIRQMLGACQSNKKHRSKKGLPRKDKASSDIKYHEKEFPNFYSKNFNENFDFTNKKKKKNK